MDVSYPESTHWFLNKKDLETPIANVIEVEIYRDSLQSSLAVTCGSFLGIFPNINELNVEMEKRNYANIKTFFPEKIYNIQQQFLNLYQSIDAVKLYFVKEDKRFPDILLRSDFTCKDILEKTARVFSPFLNKTLHRSYSEKGRDFFDINLENWTVEEKEILFTECLISIYSNYLKSHSDLDSSVARYKNVLDAIDGENILRVYNNEAYQFKATKNLLNQKEIYFKDYRNSSKRSRYREDSFNDTYYNDQLDMDQQSPEFWDSI